ncbi:hypothetical protein RM572_13120 [Streptomyces sp. DSM 42041]|uniref:Uncharacterized protein n=1 Tax=Streptomyces hazeniae TaxID=3075538 RepID=A0ABU2NRU7_9ACTN|nr:hypothetical protein [Streptomyces sp. DSM 42041]MDT0379709.1 hypothetical protein [Streptomyces sp. DSM 42041]
MTKPIRHALLRALTGLVAVLVPATGCRRRTATCDTAAPAASRPSPRAADDWWPIVDHPGRVLSRPWLLTPEQRERITALALALDRQGVGSPANGASWAGVAA